MNERIQALADQAEDYADSIVDRGGEFHLAYTQKLAELLIRECTNMLPEDSIRNADGVHMFYVIREHFGVSE